jgi:uncharacterized protein (TIGR02301 family)
MTMPKRMRLILAAATVASLAGPAASQNLLDRSASPPAYAHRYKRYYAPPPEREVPPPSPLPSTATLPPATPSGATPPGGTIATPAPAGPEAPAPPYEPQLLRLSELLGALTYLQDLCGGQKGDIWRDKMTALMDAETQDETRRERFAGAYNRGFKGYELNYRQCTPNAQAIITRFLDESGRIARDVSRRYGTS